MTAMSDHFEVVVVFGIGGDAEKPGRTFQEEHVIFEHFGSPSGRKSYADVPRMHVHVSASNTPAQS